MEPLAPLPAFGLDITMAAKRTMASFSIETDQQVLVKYDDGSEARLDKSELTKQLSAEDCANVTRAFRLRQSFWRRHLPRGLMALVAGTAVSAAIITTADRPLFHIVSPQSVSVSRPDSDAQPAHVLPTPSPAATASPTPIQPSVTPAPVHAKGLVRHLTDALGKMLK